MADEVRAWSETIIIPTYKVGKPEKNPLFLEGRVYQGSSGVVYPYPVIEQISDEKEDRTYTGLFLENEYIKVLVLPELGGRIYMALDKTNSYHFIYYNRVIKPALVGLAGPWISGGIEFNWPQHHRPSTFSAVNWRIDENIDGSKTIWCSEIEIMSRMKGMHGITLHPEVAFIEVSVQLYNRTDIPQTFLWWANVAVHANDNVQAVFPPDVRAVLDHGKRAAISYPIANGVYYKVDYSPGTDISFYKNIPVPTSYMAYYSDYDFLGCYDHGRQAGMLHVANHHVVPGKKLWTWGKGEFGKSWDQQLTDEDGPYIELMCGGYSDNQPDFAWLMPGEEKSFKQYFFPYKQIGPPKNANQEVAVNLEFAGSMAQIGVYSTRRRQIWIKLDLQSKNVFEEKIEISPEHPVLKSVVVPEGAAPEDFTLSIQDEVKELLSYTPEPEGNVLIPPIARQIEDPEEVDTVENLLLIGQHLEQYRHATYDPQLYYEEALRRDPLNSKGNSALAMLYYRRGDYKKAEIYIQKAIEGVTRYNQNPYDGEAFYNYGLILKSQEKYGQAYDAFFKAAWSAAWQDGAYFELARLACRKGQYEEGLEFTRRSLRRNYFHHKARHLRIAILRRLGQTNAALRETSLSLELDRFEYGAMWERYLLVQDPLFNQLTQLDANILVEIALDYIAAGFYLEAMALLRRIPDPDPMADYYLGWCHHLDGDEEAALKAFEKGSTRPIQNRFPNQVECIPALLTAILYNPMDGKAYYYLGNYYYAHRNHAAAIECWEKASKATPDFPTIHRNLGIAYFNKLKQPERALEAYERAFERDPSDGRVLFELDQLYKRLNHPPQGRLIRLENYNTLVAQRDDLTLEYVSLLNFQLRYQEALNILLNRIFHPWEGGEGKISEQYVFSLLGLAKDAISRKQYTQALSYLEKAQEFPSNLGEGKLFGKVENHVLYYLGLVYDCLGVPNEAKFCYRTAALGNVDFSIPKYYNDPQVSRIYYQGLALEALKRKDEAMSLYLRMIAYGENHLNDNCKPDYFAVSLPDFQVFNQDLNRNNRIHCYYLMGLGYLGLQDYQNAIRSFDRVLAEDCSHQWATVHRQMAIDATTDH